MTTETLTLKAFLLERIAEDEEPTFQLPPYDCEPNCCAPAGWVGHHCLICDTREFGGTVEAMREQAVEHEEKIHARSRVLAQCKAHRAIVEIATDQIRLGREARGWDNWEDMANQTLRALASVYADHPAWREEWAL